MQFNDNLLIGPVVANGPSVPGLQAANDTEGSSPQMRGIGPLGRIFIYDIVPAALAGANLAALQELGGAGNMVLTAGAGMTKVVRPDGTTAYQLDVPRAVSLTSASDESGVNFTVSGYDIYGEPMTSTIAGPDADVVNTPKAFWQVTSIAASAAVANNVSAGTADVFGLPLAVIDAGYVIHAGWNNLLLGNAGTLTVADTTNPATSATGDVRGTFAQITTASNGARRLVLSIAVADDQCGPNATRQAALGVTQA